MKPLGAERGFTIIELLAALAILAFGVSALVDLKRALHERQARQLAQLDAITHESNALVLLRRVNPAQEPAGTRALSRGITLAWKAQPMGQSAQQLSWIGRETPARLTIFRVDYKVIGPSTVIAQGAIELLGRTNPGQASRRRSE